MEPTPWEPIHQPDEGITISGPTPERPYPQMVMEPNSPWGVREVFAYMTLVSGAKEGSAVICWNFLPRVNLCLYSRWRNADGAPALYADWRLLLKEMDKWADADQSVSRTIYLKYGAVLITRETEVPLSNVPVLEIIRKHQ